MKRLRTALLGTRGIGAQYLDALCSDDQFELIAVGDAGTGLESERLSAKSVRHYTDYRSLIVESVSAGLDVLVVSLEPRESFGFVTLAGKSGVNVFHRSPFVLNADQGRELVRLFVEHDAKMVVARPWMFDPAFASLVAPESIVGNVFAATALVTAGQGPGSGDSEGDHVGRRALLFEAYEVIDMLVHLLGTPVSVYAQCATAGDRIMARSYETQDAVMVTLRFADDLIGSVAVLGGHARANWTVTIAGADGTAMVSPGDVRFFPERAKSGQEANAPSTPPVGLALSAFGGAILSGVEEVGGAAEKHLATIATIESAYLSAKTGAPESPVRLLA